MIKYRIPDKNEKSLAFTLAEVLITLVIIGIVAALTIPTLMQRQQEMATVTAVKKAYSELSQAYTLAVKDNGTPDEWSMSDSDTSGSSKIIANNFATYLKVIKNCTNDAQCLSQNASYKYLSGNNSMYNTQYFNTLVLSDGSFVIFEFHKASCNESRGLTQMLANSCGVIGVDINGSKKPNTIGKDFFWFILSKYGILPHGTQNDTYTTFSNDCDKTSASGSGCTAWVLYNQNMDYLHCYDLGWDGKTKCD